MSLFRRKKAALVSLKIPRHYILCTETSSLAVKREAQLQWMREHDIEYLGNPQARAERDRVSKRSKVSARVVDIRSADAMAGNSRRQSDAA